MVITAQDTKLKSRYKQTEVGVIPADWEVTPLTGLVVIQHGYGFQSQYFKPFGKYRLTTPGHFHETGGFRDVGEKQKFYEGPLPEGYLLSEGDLIVAMTEQADGLLGSAAIVPISNTYLHNQRLGKVKVLSPDLSIRFLYLVFNSKNYRTKVRETAAGTKVKHTSPSKLLEILVPLPSTKAEQEAIATVLYDTDALIASLDKLIVKKRDIKQATMQQLITGKMRLPWFSGELNLCYKQTEVGVVPADWEVKKLGDVAEIYRGASPRPIEDTKWFNEYSNIGWVRISDVTNSVKFLYDTTQNLSEQGVKQSRFVKRENLIMSICATVGKPIITKKDVCIHDGFVIFENPKVNIEYLYYYLSLIENNWSKSGQTGSQMNLNTTIIENEDISFPTNPEEQAAIASTLSNMDAEIAELEKKRNKTRALKQGMMRELLTGKTRLI
jgi:type I restriction enzyme, S subunit